jgi:hypothetical protein
MSFQWFYLFAECVVKNTFISILVCGLLSGCGLERQSSMLFQEEAPEAISKKDIVGFQKIILSSSIRLALLAQLNREHESETRYEYDAGFFKATATVRHKVSFPDIERFRFAIEKASYDQKNEKLAMDIKILVPADVQLSARLGSASASADLILETNMTMALAAAEDKTFLTMKPDLLAVQNFHWNDNSLIRYLDNADATTERHINERLSSEKSSIFKDVDKQITDKNEVKSKTRNYLKLIGI